MKSYLFSGNILPNNFSFPQEFEELSGDLSWPDIEPWTFLANDMASSLYYYGALLLKFPELQLVPFAKISDSSGLYNDGYVVLACFDGRGNPTSPCVRIYDYGRPTINPMVNKSYSSFSEWLDVAKRESAQYKMEKAELDQE